MTPSTANDAYRRIAVRVADVGVAERVSAEVFDAGVEGIEERDDDGGTLLWLYAPRESVDAVCARLAERVPEARLESVDDVRDADWTEQWKRGLTATEISPRLLVRPSFVDAQPRAGRIDLVVDPGQAFGTGGHPSTHLALEWIDALAPGPGSSWRVLDVGTGTGVLAIAALRLGARAAVAFDLDPLAVDATRANAAVNGIGRGLALYRGPLDACAPVAFDLVVANLLRTELLPLVAGIAARVAPGGRAVFSGLLESECPGVRQRAARAGLACVGARSRRDANGDEWTALLMAR